MLANLQQLISITKDGLLWLVKGVQIEPAHVGIAAVCFLVLWIVTTRHGRVKPPQSGR